MRLFCRSNPVLVVFLTSMFLFPLLVLHHSWAQSPRPSEEAISFDPKKTDDLMEKIELINKSYTYRRGGRRDPFAPIIKSRDLLEQELREREGSWELMCDPSYNRMMPLSKFELDTLEFRGVVWGGLGVKALLKGPDGKAYNVKPGDFIGSNCGKVIKIAHKYVKIEEKYRNQEGRMRIDYKYKVLKRKEKKGPAEAEGGEGEPGRLEPGSPTESIMVNVDAEENTLLPGKGDVEKLMTRDETMVGRAREVTLGPGDYEAVIVGGAFNIDLPKTTRFKSQVTIYVPPILNQPSQTMKLGLDTEFTSHGLSEIANLGQIARFTLREKTPVFFFLGDDDFKNSGVVSIDVSRLLTVEEARAARKAAEARKEAERAEEEEGAKGVGTAEEGEATTR